MTQCSGLQPKSWSKERFQSVIVAIQKAKGAVPIFLGVASEAAAIEELRKPLADKGISLAGKTTIPQLAAVLTQCDWILSLDTGTFHVARAVELPGVVLAPAWQNPSEWLPIGHPQYRIVCGSVVDVPSSKYQMDEISVEQVTQTMYKLMDELPSSTGARDARLQLSLSNPTADRIPQKRSANHAADCKA